MGKLLLFMLVATAAVTAVVTLIRRRASDAVDYDYYPSYPESELDFEAPSGLREDEFAAPRSADYPHYTS